MSIKYIFPSTGNLNPIIDKTADRGKVASMEASIRECLASHGILVDLQRISVSPLNIIIDYELKSTSTVKEVKNRILDLSVCVGQEVKFFQHNEEPGVFSLSILRTNRAYVSLKSIIESESFQSATSPLTIAAGIDEHSNVFCFDLADQMNHI